VISFLALAAFGGALTLEEGILTLSSISKSSCTSCPICEFYRTLGAYFSSSSFISTSTSLYSSSLDSLTGVRDLEADFL
jgi:hypothetical protein